MESENPKFERERYCDNVIKSLLRQCNPKKGRLKEK